MTNTTTKRALLTSVMALLLCFTMLLGTTFAWFTDSAVSANNTITAGNLDVDLYQWTDANNSTEITESSNPLFGSDIVWEPGYTSVVYLSIKNNGSLALKYTVAIDVTEVTGRNLAEVMEYAVTDAQYGEVTSWVGGSKFVNAPGMNKTNREDIELASGAEHFFALSIHMDELAGNEYMNSSIAFDISVLAGQATVEENSFGDPSYDENADYPAKGIATVPTAPNMSAYNLEARDERNNGNYKVGSAVVPAAAAAETAQNLTLIVEEIDEHADVTIEANEEVITYDVTVIGLKEGNTTPVKVSLRIPTGKDPSTVKLYHHDTEIDCTYDPSTGYVTFESATFSPFTVVYDAESEYVAPDVTGKEPPKAIVTYESQYVNTNLEWGNFGQWSPTAGLEANLDAAFVFACPDSDETAYDGWYCDFYVSLDRALGENQIFLGGNYGSFGWIGFHNGDLTLDANTEIGLLESVTTNPWTYADVKNYVGEFTCGVGDVNNALNGATFTVALRLTNPETGETIDVNTVTYTFGGTYNIQ